MSRYDDREYLFVEEDIEDILESSEARRLRAEKRKQSGGAANPAAAGNELSGDDLRVDQHPQKRARTEQATSTTTGPEGSPAQQEQEGIVALARRLLREKYGYDTFRDEQEGAIKRILEGENALVIFPNGSGKSLCYQIPGLAFSELDKARGVTRPKRYGVTIVISPLIDLVKDQVDDLKKRGIKAECIDSTKTWFQLQSIQKQLARGDLRIIYCSPERLNNERFVESMKTVAGGVRLVAVDEAHCISELGHSFRPDYLKVTHFIDEIEAERVICLTATATARVADDICRAFNIGKDGVFRTPPYRPNLGLFAISLDNPSDKFPMICDFLWQRPGSTVVYVTLQKESMELANKLQEVGFKARAFHAGMKVEDKTKVQDDFMANRIDIVIATIAFGMGVGKPDIRNIVHYTLPSTVEEYSQQVGRAGRDGNKSTCMLYLCYSDLWIRENATRGDLPSYDSLRGLIEDIFSDKVTSLRPGETFKKNTTEQMKGFDIRPTPLGAIYAMLELRFNLLRAVIPEYNLYSYEIISLANYEKAVDRWKTDGPAEAQAILKYAEKKAKYINVHVNKIVQKTGCQRADVIKILDHLDRDGAIRLTTTGVWPRFRVARELPKTEKELDEIARAMYVGLEQKEKDALRRTQEVVSLVTGKTCFAQALAQHFGMSLPDGRDACGHCSICETGKAVELPAQEQRPLDRGLVEQVLADCPQRDDPRLLARVAFGIMSPRVRDLRLHMTKAWASMVDEDFEELLKELTKACTDDRAR